MCAMNNERRGRGEKPPKCGDTLWLQFFFFFFIMVAAVGYCDVIFGCGVCSDDNDFSIVFTKDSDLIASL